MFINKYACTLDSYILMINNYVAPMIVWNTRSSSRNVVGNTLRIRSLYVPNPQGPSAEIHHTPGKPYALAQGSIPPPTRTRPNKCTFALIPKGANFENLWDT
jgi:hypothetical protein